MKHLLHLSLVMLLGSFSFYATAQEMHYEQNWIQFEEGKQVLADIYFNLQNDVLTVRGDEGDGVDYRAAQVVSFTYAGESYYSLPLNGGYSFFKILHEGDNFAVLHKTANLPLLQYFVQQSKGSLQICEDPVEPNKKVLCEGSVGPSFGMPTYAGASVAYEVEDALFVAIGGQVHLISCKYDTKGGLFSTVPKIQKSNKFVLRRLKELVQNEQKMLALRKYVASASSDLEDPQQLIQALKIIYN